MFQATYQSYYTFPVPKHVFLLDKDDDKNDGKNPGSWWVKWAILFYIDKNGKEIEVQGIDHSEHKYPDEIMEIDEVDDENFCTDWETDDLALELNYGRCHMNGRHPDTNDEDWALFLELCDHCVGYSEEMYRRVEKRLEERKKTRFIPQFNFSYSDGDERGCDIYGQWWVRVKSDKWDWDYKKEEAHA
jgi:hypothetical protein